MKNKPKKKKPAKTLKILSKRGRSREEEVRKFYEHMVASVEKNLSHEINDTLTAEAIATLLTLNGLAIISEPHFEEFKRLRRERKIGPCEAPSR